MYNNTYTPSLRFTVHSQTVSTHNYDSSVLTKYSCKVLELFSRFFALAFHKLQQHKTNLPCPYFL